MVETGIFLIETDNITKQGSPVFRYKGNMTIDWPGGRKTPPKDHPPCGFDGEFCPNPSVKGRFLWLYISCTMSMKHLSFSFCPLLPPSLRLYLPPSTSSYSFPVFRFSSFISLVFPFFITSFNAYLFLFFVFPPFSFHPCAVFLSFSFVFLVALGFFLLPLLGHQDTLIFYFCYLSALQSKQRAYIFSTFCIRYFSNFSSILI